MEPEQEPIGLSIKFDSDDNNEPLDGANEVLDESSKQMNHDNMSSSRGYKSNRYQSHEGYSSKREYEESDNGLTIDNLAMRSKFYTLKEFLEIREFNTDDEVENVQTYLKYKTMYLMIRKMRFFYSHNTEEWFKEKYDPSVLCYQENKNSQIQEQFDFFYKAYLNGTFNDFGLDEINDDDRLDGQVGAMHPSLELVQSLYTQKPMLIVKLIHPSITREQLLTILTPLQGFEKLLLSGPMPYRRFYRNGWVIFDKTTDASLIEQLDLLKNVTIDNFQLHFSIYKLPHTDNNVSGSQHRIRVCNEEFSKPSRIQSDLSKVKSLISKLDKQYNLEEKHTLFDFNDENNEATLKKHLDILILYLRNVYNVCYYCASMYDNEFELFKECGYLHLRKSIKENEERKKSTNVFEDTMKQYDEKINNWLQPIPEHDNLDEMVSFLLVKNYSISEYCGSKQKCSKCSKAFENADYILKHFNLKHASLVEEVNQEVKVFMKFIDSKDWDWFIMEVIKPPSYNNDSHFGRNSNHNSDYKSYYGKTYSHTPRHQGGGSRDYGSATSSPHFRELSSSQDVKRRRITSYYDLDAPTSSSNNVDLDYGQDS